jgi:microcystin-dependent protein
MNADPLNPTIQMGIHDITSPFNPEPVIQQWSLTSSIVNGVFKVGNKSLNNEPDALNMTNSGNTTSFRQGSEVNMILDGANARARFTGVTDPLTYVDIGMASGGAPAKGTIKVANDNAGQNNNIVIDPTKITGNTGVSGQGRFILGANTSAPYDAYMSSKSAIEFVVADIVAPFNLTPLTLNADGTATMVSTLNVPTLRQVDIVETLDGANQLFRFQNVNNPLIYSDIKPSSIICANEGTNPQGITDTKTQIESTELGFYVQPNRIGRIFPSGGSGREFNIRGNKSIQFAVNEGGIPTITSLQLLTNGTAQFISTVSAPTVVAPKIINEDISTLVIHQAAPSGTPIGVDGSLRIFETAGPNGAAGINYLQSSRVVVKDSAIVPKILYPAGNSDSQIIQNVLQNSFGAPTNAVNSMEFIQNSQNTGGGFQYYHAQDGSTNTPEWLGGFQYNPKEFRLASTVNASLPQLVNVSTINNEPINAFGVPTGSMIAWCPFVPVAPVGYLICDGSVVDQSTYPSLFAVIGNTYTEFVSPTTFRIPNMCGKVSMGSVPTLTNSTPGVGAVSIYIPAIALVAITDNSTGITTNCLRCSYASGPVYRGMACSQPGLTITIERIIAGPGDTFYIFPNTLAPLNITGPYDQTVPFIIANDANATLAPYIGNNNAIPSASVPGKGQGQYKMRPEEVAPHVHSGRNGGNPVSAPGSTRTEPAGGDTGLNNNLYSYTDPTIGATTQAEAMRYIPPNLSTWFIIKT